MAESSNPQASEEVVLENAGTPEVPATDASEAGGDDLNRSRAADDEGLHSEELVEDNSGREVV